MKKILLTAGALLAWTGCAVAGAGGQTVSIPTEDYKAILQRLDTLQKRVDQMEKADSPSAKASTAAMPSSKIAKDVETIFDTLDKVETKTLKDRINLGAELRTRVDSFKLKDDPTPAFMGGIGAVDHNDNYWTNRFRLNLDSEIQKNLLFTGRVTAYKNFANEGLANNDANQAHMPGNSSLKLDRAYVDWIPEGMPIPLALTFGRHPSSEGPPSELKENRLRQSTYPSLLFDGEADGVVATVGLERYLGWKNSGIRFAWGKGYQDSHASTAYLDNPGNQYDDTNVYAMFFETEIPGVRDSLIVLSALRAEDINSAMLGTGTAAAKIGNMSLFGIHAQANNVVDSGFDVFLSTGMNKTDPNGRADGAFGMGLLNNDGTTEHSGWSVFTGLRYNIAYKPWNNPKVGFEYNHGSEYWASFTWGSSELYNKLATRGDAYDLYYLQPFNDNLFGRLGYTHINYDHGMATGLYGEPGDSNASLDNVYFLLDCRF